MGQPFVHLHVHSEYSLADGLVRIPGLVEQVGSLDMPAVAVTDLTNLFSAAKFYRAAMAKGVKPIVGADVVVRDDDNSAPYQLVLLCQNEAGFRNLSALISRAYRQRSNSGVVSVPRAWLDRETATGLIALSGGSSGDLGSLVTRRNSRLLQQKIKEWQDVFDDRYYVEIWRLGNADEDLFIDAAVDAASVCKVPVVATNNVRFLRREDFEAHEARVCIHEGRTLADPRRPRAYTEQQYLCSADDMSQRFSDLPEALQNTVSIAVRCNLDLEFGSYHLPEFPLADGASVETTLRQKTNIGLKDRFASGAIVVANDEGRSEAAYLARMERELAVIEEMGFAGYFLIVADFIEWAKANGVAVGPGRGSGAGSLAAFALGITELDPLLYDLLFERFLNPERVSMPDFDIDFCMDRRDEVIEYVAERYGREKVAQIITYGTMAAKAVVRDVGRVLGFPYGFVDQLAKLIPFDPNMTLTRALADEAELQRRFDEDEEVKSILDLALSLEGIARNAGRHAGGLVIAPRPLTDYMPLYLEPNSEGAVTQFDMGDVEAIGLVKFDFLGLRTLTIIDWALAEINSARETPVEIGKIPLDDEATYELVRAQQTTAIFQLESRGMRELIKRLRPDCFGDLIALVALFRPGPLQSGMVDDFIERKHGRAQVKYPHPSLAPILLPTYGVILYQEQVMQIAQVLGGYTLGAADLLRRAMGKKKAEEMAEQREIFVSGAVNNAVDGELAAQIFDLMEKFAGYGFNKSHSAAYALIAYQTAWLKVHYPAAFMAAVLSSDMDSTEKVVRLIDECRALGIEVVSPDVNRCEFRFRVADDNTILYGLGAIKGVGESLISTLVEQREAEGSYDDLLSLCQRNYGKRLNRRALEALIRAGALDCFSLSRAQLTATLEQALTIAEQGHKSASAGQSDLFGDDSQAPCGIPQLAAAAGVREWTMDEVLEGEKNTLGHYLSGHPIDRYREELSQIVSASLAEVQCGRRRVAGIVDSVRSFKTRRGMNASVILDDNTARIELTLFRDVRDRYINRLVDGAIIVAEGNFEEDDYSGGYRLNVEQVYSIEEARNRYARAIVIDLNQEAFNPQTVPALKEIFSNYRNGHCSIEIEYSRSGGRARVKLGEQWQVEAADGLLNLLNDTVRGGRIHVEY